MNEWTERHRKIKVGEHHWVTLTTRQDAMLDRVIVTCEGLAQTVSMRMTEHDVANLIRLLQHAIGDPKRIKIRDVPLSARARRVLVDTMGLVYLDEVAGLLRAELSNIKNCGGGTVNEIIQALAHHGLALRDE